jgi:hypothetical protein
VALAIVANSNRGTSTSSFWLSPTIEWIGDIKIEERERERERERVRNYFPKMFLCQRKLLEE